MSGARFRVKVCGMTRQADADMCIRHGAGMLGFIFHPASPRNIAPEDAAAIRTPGVVRVGVFVSQGVGEVQDIMARAGLDIAQLAGDHDRAACMAIGPERVMRVFRPEVHARRAGLEAELAAFDGAMALALLDAGTAGGGHGRTLDFAGLAGLRSPTPWLLAGGLSPQTLPAALEQCTPDGVDLNSGVESAPGRKDEVLVGQALALLRGA